MSKQVPPNRQGELQGAITSIQSFVAMFAPLMMTQIFNTFTDKSFSYYIPGAPFYTSGVIIFIAFILFLRCLKLNKESES